MNRKAGMALIWLVLIVLVSVAGAQPSVPNVINFQGRLTDTAGKPVADGTHSVKFTIFTAPSGGSSVWSESTSVTTSSGLFTFQLGSVSTLPGTLFQDYDSLYLEIVAEGQTISPRTRLTSAPYSRVADGLEVRYDATDSVVIATTPWASQLSTYGWGQMERTRIWGNNWSQILMQDANPSSNVTVEIDATQNSGGQLYLLKENGSSGLSLTGGSTGTGSTLAMRNDIGGTTISMDADMTGNSAVVLPTSSISSSEILDEPGVSNSINPTFFVTLGSGNIEYVIDSVDITLPAPGYVEVTAGCYLNLFHTNGTETEVYLSIDKTRANASYTFPGSHVASIPSGTATGLHQAGSTITRLYSEGAGVVRYYFNVYYAIGSSTSTNIANSYIRAKYYPTLYGTVSIATENAANAAQMSNIPSDGSKSLTMTGLKTITIDEHNARLAAEQAKIMSEMEARIKKLEELVKQNPPATR